MCEIELLKYAIDNGIIDIDTVQAAKEMYDRNELLKQHTFSVWESKDGVWHTYLPDAEKGRLHRKRKSKEEIEDVIVEYWKKNIEIKTIKTAFDDWIESKIAYDEIAKGTYDRYRADYVRFISGTNFEKIEIKNLTEVDIEDFVKSTIKKYNLKAKSWSGLRTIIIGSIKRARKLGWCDLHIRQILQDMEISKKSFKTSIVKDEDNVFTDEEVNLIFEHMKQMKNSYAKYGVAFAFNTGLRIGELSSIKWTDVSRNYDYVSIRRTQIRYKDENGNVVYVDKESPKTEAGIRDVVLNENAREILKEVRKMNPFGEYVFLNKEGKQMKANSFTRALYVICDELGIPRRSLHKARKTYATKLINANVDEKIIMNQMGHTDITTTRKYYYFNNKGNEEIKNQLKKALDY